MVIGSAANLVSAEPADERPKEGDVLVRLESEKQIPLEPKDIPFGGPQVFAWPMDLAANVVRSASRLNKVLLVRLDPATLIGSRRSVRRTASSPIRRSARMQAVRSMFGPTTRRPSSALVTTRTTIRVTPPPLSTARHRARWPHFH